MTARWALAIVLAAACASPVRSQDKDSFTPMALDAGFGPMSLAAPEMATEQIIQKFAAKESEFQQALNHYTYRRVARVQTIDDDNKVDGEYYEVDDVIFEPSGRRVEKVVFAPVNTLERVSMSPSDMQDIQKGYPFVLTSELIGEYNVKYIGRQKVDDVDCYVFEVGPKAIEKGKRYLQGRVWVDAEDLQIVVTNGKMVPDDTRKGSEDLHPPFMTWRAQIDGHYWFPIYTKAEGMLHFAAGRGSIGEDVHLRSTIKYSDYKQFGSSVKLLYNGEDITNKADPTAKPDATAPTAKPPQK